MTQQELADSVSVSRVYIQSLESNRRHPSMKLLKRLAPVLNVDMSVLLADVINPTASCECAQVPDHIELEKMLENGELEIWYRKKKLPKKQLNKIYRIIKIALEDWESEEQAEQNNKD